jgi:acetyl esterase
MTRQPTRDSENGPSGERTFVDRRLDGPGVTRLDPADPAAAYYGLLARLRSPLTLRELMIERVRTGYIGDGAPPDPNSLPPSAEVLYPDVGVGEIAVPSAAGPIRCQVFTPPGDAGARPVMLYVHGGGFTVGRSEDTAYITSRFAAELGMVVVSVNYRLAPEWPFPAGLDDTVAVYRWLREHGGKCGGDSAFVAVAGDSAGGNLAAALPLRLRDEGLSRPDAVVLMCPITDFVVEKHESFERLAPLGIIYDTAFVGFIRGAYLVHHRNWTHPYASPIYGDLSDYPPTVVVAGEADPIVDDNRAFVAALRLAGCEVALHVAEKMPHGYYFFPRLLPAGEGAFAAVSRFLEPILTKSLSEGAGKPLGAAT